MKRIGWFLAFFGFLLQVGISVDNDQRWARVVILHTNDTHGNLLPFSYPENISLDTQEAKLAFKSDIGGVARRATLLQQLRQELPGQTLTVDCGDFMDGTPFSLRYKGSADVAVMNACGYEYATLGNHEFNNTLTQVKKLIKEAKFTFVGANVVDRKTGKPLCTPYAIAERDGVKIAFFGLVTTDTRTYPAAEEGVDIPDAVEAARQIVPELRKQADLVVLLSHLGIQEEESLARRVPGIDVIVGGHSHTRLTEARFIDWNLKDAPNLGGTLLVQAHQWGGELGRLDLLIGRDPETQKWRLMAYKYQLLPITDEIPEDPKTAKVVERYWKPIAKQYGEVVARATDDFVQRGDDLAHYYLVGDCVRAEMGSQLDFQNVSGIRIQLARGAITRYDLAKMMPFGNTVVKFEIKGRELKEILQRRRPTVSGIRYRVENGQLTEATVDGKSIDDDAVYTGTTNSYFAKMYLKPLNVDYVDTGEDMLEVVARHLRKVREVSPAFDGRRVIKN